MSKKLRHQLLLIAGIFMFLPFGGWAQNADSLRAEKEILDSLFISEVEDAKGTDKVLHAEPLYIDLIRDLGARKGEKEWNIGMGITDNLKYDTYQGLVEYEWAPVNRLGLEVELPFTIVAPNRGQKKDSIPGSKINGIKTAIQWSFLVKEKWKTSMALGYINELEMNQFNRWRNAPFFIGNIYNPFFVAAKRWGNNWHTLLYTGPVITHYFKDNSFNWQYQINTNFHYMIPGTRNFVGVELNKQVYKNDFDMVIRPQLRLQITEHTLIGIVAGVPIEREDERFSAFARLIYEPPHRTHKKGRKH
jgi:hypothetical protein